MNKAEVFQNKHCLSIIALGLTIFMLSGCLDENKSPKCNENLEEVQQTLSQWLKDAMVKKDDAVKDINVIITNINDIYEYISSPMLLGTTLYDNYKDSRICQANASVEFSGPNINKNLIKTINVRYQITHSIEGNNGMQMAGSDVSDLGKNGVKKLLEAIVDMNRDNMRTFINQAPLTTPIIGSVNSKNDILVFFDFSCQYSKRIADDIIKLSKEAKDTRFIFMPLSFVTDLSPYLAKASLVANKQGYFLPYYEAVMENNKIGSTKEVDKICEKLGLDMQKYRQDMEDTQLDEDIKSLMLLSQKVKVQGTPSVYVNGYFIQNPNYYTLKDNLESKTGNE